ncbi:MAG: hypothetical protein ABIP85_09395 [Chthoniobacteraceae bacterium]
MSAETFPCDVFPSHSAKDKRSKPPTLMHDTGGNAVVRPLVVRPLAERLLAERLLAKRLRADGVKVISLHPSPSAPLNKERRFLPLRLDDAPIKGSLAQFLYIN